MNAKEKVLKDKKTKIDYEGAEKLAFRTMVEIRLSSAANSVKAQKERRLGKSLIVKLAGRSSRKEENQASLSYFNREVTKLRTAIRHEGFLRHDFNDKVLSLSKEYPIAKNELLLLVDIKHNDAKKLKSNAIDKLSNRLSRTQDDKKVTQLKDVIKKLKKISYEPVVFETLVRTATQKEDLNKNAEVRIEKYHTTQRPVDYHKTYKLMAELLTAEHNWMALTFGLVLASGRRSAEIVCYLDGEFKKTRNSHEALFTSRVKTKEDKTFKIPLLVDYATFSKVLATLRQHPRIAKLIGKYKDEINYDKRHKGINSSIQQQLNEFVKNRMDGKEWVLKDGRAIYARITYAEYSASEKKAGRLPMADDLFFKQKLGHTDSATQQNYKQFQMVNIEKLNHREVKKTKAEAKEQSQETRDRLSELAGLFETETIQERRAFVKYSEWVLEQVKAEPATKITSSWIKASLGGNKGIIAEFVRLIKDAGLQQAF